MPLLKCAPCRLYFSEEDHPGGRCPKCRAASERDLTAQEQLEEYLGSFIEQCVALERRADPLGTLKALEAIPGRPRRSRASIRDGEVVHTAAPDNKVRYADVPAVTTEEGTARHTPEMVAMSLRGVPNTTDIDTVTHLLDAYDYWCKRRTVQFDTLHRRAHEFAAETALTDLWLVVAGLINDPAPECTTRQGASQMASRRNPLPTAPPVTDVQWSVWHFNDAVVRSAKVYLLPFGARSPVPGEGRVPALVTKAQLPANLPSGLFAPLVRAGVPEDTVFFPLPDAHYVFQAEVARATAETCRSRELRESQERHRLKKEAAIAEEDAKLAREAEARNRAAACRAEDAAARAEKAAELLVTADAPLADKRVPRPSPLSSARRDSDSSVEVPPPSVPTLE
jgi:hypothetical protein